MAEVTVTPRQRKILAEIQFDRQLDVASIGKKTTLKPHLVRYEIARLREQQIIRPGVLFDPFKLGLFQYQVYLAIGFSRQEQRDRFIRFLESSSQIIWYGHLGGSTQYGFTLCVRSQHEVSNFFEKLAKESGITILLKRIGQISMFALYQKAYLTQKSGANRTSIYLKAGEPAEIPNDDRKALIDMLEMPDLSIAERASRTGIPRTSLALRIERLKRDNVLLREIYFISARRMGFQTFRFLVLLKGFREQIEKSFLRFCEQNAHIVSLAACIGSWDYELTVEAETSEGIVTVSERLMAEFSEQIQHLEVLPVFLQSQPQRPLVQILRKGS